MKKSFFVLFALSAFVFGATKPQMEELYKRGEYAKACFAGRDAYHLNQNNEKFMMNFGNACVKSDMIDLLVLPASKLGNTPEARESSLLFYTLLMKKRLLGFALIDGKNVETINLPKIDHPLSNAFDAFVSKNYKKNGEIYETNDKTKMKFWLEDKAKKPKIVIEENVNGKVVKHSYW